MSRPCDGTQVFESSVPNEIAVAIQAVAVVACRVSTGAAKLQVVVRDVAILLQDSFQTSW